MDFGKKVVIAIDLHETTEKHLEQLEKLSFLKNAEIHFVHVCQTTIMTYGLADFCQVYPTEPDRKEIDRSVISAMKRLYEGHVDPGAMVITRCLFDENPKEEFCLYAKEVKADTIIIFSRERHGIFDSSFAQYAARHSPCHILILRP